MIYNKSFMLLSNKTSEKNIDLISILLLNENIVVVNIKFTYSNMFKNKISLILI